jgi:hypothetical protein
MEAERSEMMDPSSVASPPPPSRGGEFGGDVLVVITVTPFIGDPSGVMGGVAGVPDDRLKRLKDDDCLLEESSERE